MSYPTEQIPLPARLGLRIDDAAKVCGLGRSSIYNLLARGEIRSIKIGGRRLVLRESLEDLFRKKGVQLSP